ncbi:structural maintenance of chromosomes protein 5 [Chironomus tepperi]|uniref:structural maintenance of chromosomes protein 5 n=1 Tax=Chironomus tepperi TaxID=113505 RepID=UPI00391EE3B4
MNNIGKIQSVAVRNFITYDELKFIPGSYLNIIIGPNGTGKSSIIAAIILGCGGKPSILSRAKDVSDYVKNGKVKANIEVELIKNDNGDTTIFSRTFDKDSKEIFKIDGEKVSAKVYSETVKSKYNIHVDNLCMFLPQDRVQDFTKLNPQEILYNTQTSVCSQEIIDTFESLKQKREQQKNLTKSNIDMQVQLEDHINRNNQLHSLIENSKLKDNLLKELDMHKKKHNWLEYDRIKARYDEAANDVKILHESIENKKALLKPLEKRQAEIAGTKKNLQASISKSEALMVQCTTDTDKLLETSTNLESDISRVKQDFRNAVTNAKTHEKDIKEHEFLVSLDRKEYEEAEQNLQEEGDVNATIHKYDNSMRKNKAHIEDIMQKMETMNRNLEENIIPQINNSKRKIEQMKDTGRQRFNILRSKFEDAYQAYQWLDSNRNKFRGHIYNPIITEITVTDKKYAKYVENTIANRDFETFLCTNKEDMKDLIVKFRNELKLNVNVGYTDPDETLRYQTEIPLDRNLKNLGIFAFVLDVIDGPIPVLNYLCSLYRIHNTAIGNDKTSQCASQIPDNVNVFFSTNHRFVVNISAYSGKKSTSSGEIFARNILNVGIDQDLLKQEEERLQRLIEKAEEIKSQRIPLQQRIKTIEEQQNELRNQKNVLNGKIRNLKTIENKLKKKEAELEILRNHKIDINEERKKSKNKIDKIIAAILANNLKVCQTLERYKECQVQNLLARKKLQVFDDSTGNVDGQIDKLKYDLNKVEETLRRANNSSHSLQEEMNRKKEAAMKETDGQSPNDRKFKYKDDFSKLPDTPEALLDKIFEMQGRIDCIRGVDPKVLVEYEERKQIIEELEHQLKSEYDRTVHLDKELKLLHSKWFPEIERIVETINNNFSTFFAKMGFVGEVELIRKEEHDYNDYGIQIRVQYRDNEKLQALNRHVQSGGERAVAIAIYTLSLQHLTVVPFRCVDEINQGMDPKNERKIFQMLVDITCQPGQSQYFFVTPKLLPKLPYNDLMTVSIVHNGKYIEDSYVFMK